MYKRQVYAYSPTVARQPLALPMLALRCTAEWPAQFVFDKGQTLSLIHI